MSFKHLYAIIVVASFLISISPMLGVAHASQPATGSKGNTYVEALRTARTLKPDETMLVWMDINATVDANNDYWLPADPALYGIKWITITFDPDVKQSNLIWLFAKAQAKDVETLIKIPWVFDMKLVRVGGLDTSTSQDPKFSIGLQHAIDRALQRDRSLQVIVWVENATGSIRKSVTNMEGIKEEVLLNVTTTINQFGGKLLRDHYQGSKTLLTALPPQSIAKIRENPFITKLCLNGPVVAQGFDSTQRFYGGGSGGHGIRISEPAILSLPVALLAIARSDKRTRRRFLTLIGVAVVISVAFYSKGIPSAYALDISTPAIQATNVWATGNRGGGINVAVIDTGIDLNHNDFVNAIVDRINMPDRTQNVQDTAGHGTHVAGIVAGRGVQNPIYTGVAPDAGLVIVRVVTGADLEPAVRWVIGNRTRDNIRVIQSSVGPVDMWGNPILGGDGLEHPYSIAMDDAVESGIVVIQAAGNSGPGQRTIACPGNAFNVITVGAVNDQNTANIADDNMGGWTQTGQWIDFSSRGPTGGRAGGRPKPDVVAPGYRIISTRAQGTDIRTIFDAFIDPNYVEATGTSMAAPHVSGTAALILHANPNLTPAQVKAILRQTARLNTNLNGFTVNDRGYGIIDALGAVQLAPNVGNIQLGQMYDSWDESTPGRDLGFWCYDYLTFRVDPASSTWGISLFDIQYHYRHPLGIGNTDYELIHRMFVIHVWLDGIYYDLGTNMNRYLFSAPRIYEQGGGYVLMRALYRVGSVNIEYMWRMNVDEFWLRLTFSAGTSWRTLHYIDPDVWDSTNYAYLPSTSETILYERKIWGDTLLDIRDPEHAEYIQLDPLSTDNPIMWVLRYGYFGNNPDSALNSEYIYNRDIVVYYQASSYYPDPGPAAGRHNNPAVTPNTNQNDANSGGDAGNNFNTATPISPSSYYGILSLSDPEDTNDYYKFTANVNQSIYVSLTPPLGIDFDLQLYDPAGNLKAASYYGAGSTDSVSYTADSSGYWTARIFISSGEARYTLYVSVTTPGSGGGGGGGCPILYVYDGKEYVSEGLLDIHDPDGIDVVVEHTQVTTPKRADGEYLIQLVEHPQTISHIDQVQLFAILKDKTLVELSLLSATHSEDGDVLPQLLFSDDVKADELGANHNNGVSQTIALRFKALSPNIQAVGFVFHIEGNNRILKE